MAGVLSSPRRAVRGHYGRAQRAEVFKAIENLTRDKVARGEARGVRRTVRVMVVGVPNVGKSTIINQLHGGAIAQAGNRPGATRANQWVRVGEYLEVLDTPGLLWPKLDDPVAARRLAYISAIRVEAVDTFALSSRCWRI
ncbi:MAG: GTPase [Christensenellales bacterium]